MKFKNAFSLAVFSLLILSSCDTKEGIQVDQSNPYVKLHKTEYLGCFLDNSSNKSTMDSDTVFYEMVDDTLLLHLVMNQNCGYCLKDSLTLNNDVVGIYISDTCGWMANCMCDYNFDYYFTDFGNELTFNIFYKPIWESEYTYWNSLSYP